MSGWDTAGQPRQGWDRIYHGDSPMARTLAWHRDAAEGDARYLAEGPVDDGESSDPYHPWRGAA